MELLTSDGPPLSFIADGMREMDGTAIDATPRAMMEFTMPLPKICGPLSILRRVKGETERVRK